MPWSDVLAGFHALNYSMFKLAHGYRDRGMAAYSELQEEEFAAEADGYSATKHQHEVGTAASTMLRASSPAAKARPRPCEARPKKSSFIDSHSARDWAATPTPDEQRILV
jgi:hypothetical protein